MNDVNVINENTIATLLGIPHLAIWELVRDKVAYTLCADPITEPLGLVIGSIPLQEPYVPFKGSMRLTPEAKDLGWNIPEEFIISIPSVYNEFGFNAYTQVGWQLVMPRALAYVAWWKAQEYRTLAEKLYDKLSRLMENITYGVYRQEKVIEHVDYSLKYELRNFYKGLITANISDSSLTLTVNVPELEKNITLTVNISEALHHLLQLLPARVVAVSEDGLAGILVYDKYWDPNGYRSVYFSFEIEAADGSITEHLLNQAVKWAR